MLTGEITDNDALSVEQAEVRIFVSGGAYRGSTDAAGRYRIVAALPDRQLSGTLNYTVTYVSPMGKAETSANQSFSVRSGELETLDTDFNLDIVVNADYDRIAIDGLLSNLTAPFAAASERLDVLVEGSGPTADFGTVCRTYIREGERGYFSCGTRSGIAIPRRGTIELRYTVMLDGKPVAASVTERYEITPSTTLISRLYPEVRVEPAVIKLSGKVVDLAAQPVPQATFEVTEPVRREVKTDAQGDYTLYLPLPVAETSGTLQYHVKQSGVLTDFVEEAYSVAARTYQERTLGTTELNFNLFGRTLHFGGTALPQGAPDLRLENTTLVISSPTEGVLCEAEVNSETGAYACSTFVTTPERTLLSYMLQGTWGAATYEGEVSGGLFGSEETTTRDFSVPVTVLELSGAVVDDASVALADASVTLSGVLSGELSTDENGQFATKAILPGTLQLAAFDIVVERGGFAQTRVFSLPLTQGELNTSSETFVFTQRSVDLSGRLVNRFAPTMTLAGSDLTLYLNGNEVCRTETNFTGSFGCPTLMLDSGHAAEFTFTASGSWGSDTGVVTLAAAEIPQAGTQGSASLELVIEPTMVQVSGVVADDRGSALEGAQVRVGGDYSASTVTTANGTYSARFLVENASGLVDLMLDVEYGEAGLAKQEPLSLDVNANTLNEVVRDITFTQRAVEITGTVFNLHLPEMAIGEVVVLQRFLPNSTRIMRG